MSRASIVISGFVGLALAIPVAGSLIPVVGENGESWNPLDSAGWAQLQASTKTPVQIDIKLNVKDAYLPEASSPQSVWGIRVRNLEKFKKARPDLFTAVSGKDDLPYKVVNLGFAIFSPICPHLGCYYAWEPAMNRFLCKCHGSQYTYDGEHIAGPAARGLDPLPLREKSGIAQVEWIRYYSTTPNRIVLSYAS